MSTALASPVLVLNRHWRAFRVVDASKALCLLFKGVAEVIDVDAHQYAQYDFASWAELSEFKHEFEPDEHKWVRTVSRALAIPTVIRLIRMDRFHQQKVRLNRRNIYARDGRTCQYCGNRFSTRDLNLDHVIPQSRGGKTTWENIVCSCITCNTKKGARTPAEARMKLIREPKPLRMPADLIGIQHDSWKHFVDAAYWNVELI